jgi:signal transduction histidine kinase
MYLKRPELPKITRTIGFRLTLWYAVMSLIISLILFGVAYWQIANEIDAENRLVIQDEMNEYVVAWQFERIKGLDDKIRLEQSKETPSTFFVRIADSNNKTLFLSLPSYYDGIEFKKLEQADAVETTGWLTVKMQDPEDEDTIDVMYQRLPDGTLIQIGRNSDIGEKLLEQSRTIFLSIIAGTLFLGMLGGGILAFRALSPIKKLVDTIHTIKTGDMKARVPLINTGDDMDNLISLFNDMLEKIERLMNGMRETVDNVAHDLRTPITRIRSMTERILSKDADKETLRNALMDCAEEMERISTLLNTIMDIAEAETGVLKLRLEDVDVTRDVAELVELYRYVAEEKGVSISLDMPDSALIHVDRARLRQVIANLLDNAIKYTEVGGGVHIRLWQDPAGTTISVKDTGIGIHSSDIPRIFDRLYRADKSRHQKGLGLGLSLVRAIVNAHNGSIEVKSAPGAGSEFRILLPAI